MTRVMRLDQVPAGETVRMLGFVRCRRYGLRLTEMGFTPGTLIAVLQAARGQPMLLRVRGAQLAIDRATARKIEVEHGPEGSRIRSQGQRAWRRRGHQRGPGWGGRQHGWKHWRDPHQELIEAEVEDRER